MANESNVSNQPVSAWQPKVAYAMASACLILGLLVGYLLRGSGSSPAPGTATPETLPAQAPSGMRHPAATLKQMKQLADKQALPVLEQLKKDPGNKDLLVRAAQVYASTHQFEEAVSYFGKALEVDPTDVKARTEMAACLYYDGDADSAIDQLQRSLKYSPKDINALFNLGMIQWKGKNDPGGAIATWQQLLRTNPNLDRRPLVEKMVAEARQQQGLN